jgi:hypothetical protein
MHYWILRYKNTLETCLEAERCVVRHESASDGSPVILGCVRERLPYWSQFMTRAPVETLQGVWRESRVGILVLRVWLQPRRDRFSGGAALEVLYRWSDLLSTLVSPANSFPVPNWSPHVIEHPHYFLPRNSFSSWTFHYIFQYQVAACHLCCQPFYTPLHIFPTILTTPPPPPRDV